MKRLVDVSLMRCASSQISTSRSFFVDFVKLLKYYVARSIKKNEMKWPVDTLGRRICHVAHPKSYRFDQTLTMPCADDNDEKEWCHVKARQLKNSDQAYCPICQRRGKLGLPVEVSGSFSQ